MDSKNSLQKSHYTRHPSSRHSDSVPMRRHNGVKAVFDLVRTVVKSDEEKKEPFRICKQLGLTSMLKAMISPNHVYKFQLGYGGGATGNYITCNTTLGVISAVITWPSIAAASSDWTAVSSLFDEYTIDTFSADLTPQSAGFNLASPGLTVTAMDDDGGVSVANLNSNGYDLLLGYSTFQAWCPAVQGSTLTTEANSTGFHPIRIRYTRPFPAKDNDVCVNGATTGWTDIASPSNNIGSFCIFNSDMSTTNNANAYQYVAWVTIRTRCRR